MKKAAHSKKKLAHRVRVGVIAAMCLVAIFAVVVCVGTISGNLPFPTSSTSDTFGSSASNTQNQKPTNDVDSFIANTEAANASVQEIESAEAVAFDLAPAAPQIVVENPTFPDTSTFVTVEDENLPAHQQSVALVMLPEGTTRNHLTEMLSEAPYVDASDVSDSEIQMGLVALTVADGVALTDAINALEHIPGIDGAQPNFVYTIADESLSAASVSSSAPSATSSISDSAAGSSSISPNADTSIDVNANDSTSSPNTNSSASESGPSASASTSASDTSSSSTSSASDSASSAPTDEFIVSIAAAINDAEALAKNNYWQLESINAFDAWSQLGYSAASDRNPIGIAIIDTGANTNHGDLKDRIVATYNSQEKSSNVSDSNGHGTHVAGIAAATTNNGIGVSGVSYNSNLVIIKASTGEGTGEAGGSFSTQTIANAYTWLLSDPDNNGKTVAQENNVRVINMSIEHASDVATWDTTLLNKITKAKGKGILTVCAAGNSDKGTPPYLDYPGDYKDALSVINLEHSSSSNVNDASGLYYVRRNNSSNYNTQARSSDGTYAKDISAPGTSILSTIFSSNSSYDTKTGTSMASPLVAGVAALVYAAGDKDGKTLDADTVRRAIQETARDLGDTGWDAEYGYGEVNADAAVKMALGSYVVGSTLVGTNETAGEEVYTVQNPGSGTWTWSSSNTNVATIDASTGELTPQTAGTTVVAATDGSTTRSLAITVINPSITCTAATGYYSNIVCNDPNDKLSYVWGYDDVTYGVVENGAASTWGWKWSGTAGASVYGTISADEGVLRTESPGLSSCSTVTITATCTSNEKITISKTISVKPVPNMSGVSSIYSGLGAQFSLSNTVDSDVWTWSVSDAGASITSQDSDSCILKTDEGTEGTAVLVARIDNTEYRKSISVSKASIVGDSSIAAESSAVYYLANKNVSVTWRATINDEDLDGSIATLDTGTASGYPAARITAAGKTSSPIVLAATISDSLGNTISCDRMVYIISGNLSELNVDIAVDDRTYTGSAQTPTPVVKITGIDDEGNPWSTELVPWSVLTRNYADYKVSYSNNVNAGTATITIEGINSYTGSVTGSFTIAKRDISTTYSDGSVPAQTYSGSQIKPTPPALYANQGAFFIVPVYSNPLTKGIDYTVGYGANKNAGTGTIVYTGKGNFTGTKTVSFTINRAPLTNMTVSGSYTYTGSAIRPGVTVTASGASGSPTYSVSCSNNVNAGTAYVTVSGTGNFTGTITRSFAINRRNINEASMSVNSQTYTGSALTPNPTITWSGRTLSNGSDYTVSYANNTNMGTATTTATGIGNYTGSKSATFEITAGAVSMYRLYNPNSGEHFYTANAGERDGLTGMGWRYEGIGWTAPSMSATPVYRLYNANGGEHHYTTGADERDALVSLGWSCEGIGWYSDDQQRVPLYRDFNPNAFSNNHNFTTSQTEHEMLVNAGWRSEGYAWYGM